MNSEIEELLTIKQAAKILHVSPQTLRRWDDKGILKAVRIGTREDRRYHKKDIEEYISHKNKK
ncbi:MAG: helix-turn-helix domain-containing protein [Candidatus Woykebacteria bacterium]